MRKARRRPSTPEAMRAAVKLGNTLVRKGYCSTEEMSEALECFKKGDLDGADMIIARAVSRRRGKR